MTARPDACRHCGRTLRSMGQTVTDQPGTLLHAARGLCTCCLKWHGGEYSPLTWRGTELLAEVDALAGETPERIAARLGVTVAAIAQAAYRAGRYDLARPYHTIARRAYREADRDQQRRR